MKSFMIEGFVVYVSSVAFITSDTFQKSIHKNKLDVVLMYDQSGSLRVRSNWKVMYDDTVCKFIVNYVMKHDIPSSGRLFSEIVEYFSVQVRWVRSFVQSEQSSMVRIAIIGTAEPKKVLLNFTSDPSMIVSVMNSINEKRGTDNNVALVAETILEKIFVKEAGDREDAGNVVLFLTDCVLWREANDTSILQLHNVSKLFMLMCMDSNYTYGGQYARPKPEVEANLFKWANKDSRKVYNYTNYDDFKEYLNDLLNEMGEAELYNITDCEESGPIKTKCQVDENGTCTQVEYYNITVDRVGPLDYGKPCTENKTKICEQRECEDGTTTAQSAGSGGPNPLGKNEGSTTGSFSWTWVYVGIAIGVVLLLLLMIVVLVLLFRPKEKKKVAQKISGRGANIQSKEEDRGIKADLTTCGKTTAGSSQDKGQSNVASTQSNAASTQRRPSFQK